MTYLSPSYLPFLVLASIPVILYLLFRRKRNDLDWGATYILKKTLQTKSRQNLWKQMAILALRTLFLALLVLAFARPVLPREAGEAGRYGFPHGPGTLHRVVLLDNSRSMSALHESVTREEAAKAVLREAMLGMRAGDTFHIVPLCPERAGDEELGLLGLPCPIREKTALDTLVKIPLSGFPADLERGLRKAKEALAGSAGTNKQLILLSDLTRKDHPSIASYKTFGDVLAEMNVRTAALFLGKENATNLALESLTFGSDVLLKGQPTHVHVTVMNYSEQPSAEGFLSVLVDKTVFVETSCVLSPHQRKTLSFPFVPGKPTHHIEARLSDDAYNADNHLERSVDVKDRLSILVLHRDESGIENVFERQTEFLRRVLETPEKVQSAPEPGEREADSGGDWIRRTIGLAPKAQAGAQTDLEYDVGYTFEAVYRTAAQAAAREVQKADVVLCCEIDQLSPPLLAALLTFVRRGGGLVLAVGPNLTAESFNELFKDLLPFPLAQPFRDLAEKPDYDRFLSVQPSDIAVDLLKEFEKNTNGDLTDGRFYNHFRLQLPEEVKPESVLLRLSNGDPILLARRYGKGSVLLWASTLGGTWNSMVVHQAYLPLLVRLLNYCASFAPLSRNLAVGQPIIHDVSATPGDLFLTTPDHKLVKLARVSQGDKQFVRFEETRLPGVYELQLQAGETVARFFVSVGDEESDIRPLTAKMEKELIRSLRIALPQGKDKLPTTAGALKASLYQQDEGEEVTTWAFLAVILLLLLDATLVKLWFS